MFAGAIFECLIFDFKYDTDFDRTFDFFLEKLHSKTAVINGTKNGHRNINKYVYI